MRRAQLVKSTLIISTWPPNSGHPGSHRLGRSWTTGTQVPSRSAHPAASQSSGCSNMGGMKHVNLCSCDTPAEMQRNGQLANRKSRVFQAPACKGNLPACKEIWVLPFFLLDGTNVITLCLVAAWKWGMTTNKAEPGTPPLDLHPLQGSRVRNSHVAAPFLHIPTWSFLHLSMIHFELYGWCVSISTTCIRSRTASQTPLFHHQPPNSWFLNDELLHFGDSMV